LEVNSGSTYTNQAWTVLLRVSLTDTVGRHPFEVQPMAGRTAFLVEDRTFL
jgi:hypothetical protein